ncbi:amino acid ABC transporter substrate-binding protein [Fischerella thermalis]|uniref:amino acid ABC transporter substrate-binding protein n=1 Tax=Fischerella thermalis TaxID=372787 RepID=UPI000C80AE47|nr:amino acid ABC transporter substrate-binding protein [Fischerella thermalis]PMB47501.1 amino acid ABC transporter substrate-binding protein [Fischerella thermalis CCMEE 5205]PLZ14285.1 amino acid ABC transporter substrate-binding protein [Fischerella thermalis WC119]PLZ20589.1 amino acid ABC transporter substrate-binding protein [Fischerella thermalis WC1110]PLZ24492.1 amino acid ABC transporter substrate-binding protein [Fischerella thermalis WC341]PLZ44971.1 amino acid ABC transporter sub
MLMRKWYKWGLLLLATLPLILSMSACSSKSAVSNSRLDTIKNRGKLICGVSGQLPGFSYVKANGEYAGLDVDICRAIAAAIFDDPKKVEYRNLNAKERFTAVQTGEVDILSRNTSWTISRDTSVGLEFAPVVFYDGQGIMVRKNSNIKKLEDLKDKSICTQTGTTNEQNLSDQMRQKGITYKPLVFEDVNTTYATYEQGRCEAITSDRSQLVSRRSTFSKPDEHVVLDVVLSKEPLTPAVANGDSKWFDVVKWTVYGLINAEELGVNSQNVSQLTNSSNPEIKRLLGTEGDLGKGAGLSNDFVARIIKHVGNYGEIYERNLGKNSELKLDRGLNKLWNQGGILYAPPFR